MNVCRDSPNSLSAQVVFTSTIPNNSGNHRVPPAPQQRGNSSQFPSLLLAGIMKTPYAFGCVSLFIWSPIKPSHPHFAMGWHSPKLVGMLPANKTPAQVHIAWLQGIFKAFVLPFQGSHSKRMILWIVVVIFRNEDLVQWVLHRDQPRGEILSQKESYSWVKSTRESVLCRAGALKCPWWCREEFQPGRTTWPEGFSSHSATCPVYFLSIQREVVTAGRWRWRSPAAQSSCGQQPPGSEEGWGLLQEPFLWL